MISCGTITKNGVYLFFVFVKTVQAWKEERVVKYMVQVVSGKPDWDQIRKLRIEQYPWGQDYMPETNASVILWEQGGSGIIVRMECMEKDPKATHRENDTWVWEDSCMECFLNFAPEYTDAYLNIEANVDGVVLCEYGRGADDRVKLADMQCPPPAVKIKRLPDRWICYFLIPMETIRRLYGKMWFLPGDVIRGNFYKCGDKTAIPHYGSWNPIDSPTPDFHRPDCFGELEIDSVRL